jgi:hypothetical protein
VKTHWQVFGGDKAKSQRIANLKNDVASLQMSRAAAIAEYERVKGRNIEVRGAAPRALSPCAKGGVCGLRLRQLRNLRVTLARAFTFCWNSE